MENIPSSSSQYTYFFPIYNPMFWGHRRAINKGRTTQVDPLLRSVSNYCKPLQAPFARCFVSRYADDLIPGREMTGISNIYIFSMDTSKLSYVQYILIIKNSYMHIQTY